MANNGCDNLRIEFKINVYPLPRFYSASEILHFLTVIALSSPLPLLPLLDFASLTNGFLTLWTWT